MGLLARALVPSGLTLGRTWYPALFLSAESRRCGTHGTKLVSGPRVNQIFLLLVKLSSAPSDME
jgi:hypothetical protein